MTEFSEIPMLDIAAIHGQDPVAKHDLAKQFLQAYVLVNVAASFVFFFAASELALKR